MGLETQATGNCPVFPKQDVERLVNFLSSTYFGEISEDLLKRAKGFFYHVYVVKCKYHADMYESIAKHRALVIQFWTIVSCKYRQRITHVF